MWDHEPLPHEWATVADDPAFLGWMRARLEAHEPIRTVEPAGVRSLLVDWFMESPSTWVAWHPERFYRGPDRSNGAWGLRDDAIAGAVKSGLSVAWARFEREASGSFASLDEWLAAEAAGLLQFPGAKGGSEKLSKEMRRKLGANHYERHWYWPKNCRCCGDTFKPTRMKMVYCPECRTEKARKVRIKKSAVRAAFADGEALARRLTDPNTSAAERDYLRGRLEQLRLYEQGRQDERDMGPGPA